MSEIRLPSEWLTTNLGMIGEVVTGKTPSKKNSEYFGGAIPFIKPGDVNDQGNIEFTDEHLTELGAATVPTIPKGSIVVTCIGNLGRCAITTERSATNQQINSVLPISNVDVKFIYYQMRTLKEWMVSESSATTVTIINKSKFSQAPLVLPPLTEQKVIAEKLDTLLAQVDNTKARLERIPDILKRFRQSVLAAAVSGKLINSDTETWTPKKVDDLVKVVNGKAFPSKDYQENGVRLLRPGNLHMSGAVIWNEKNTTYIPESWKSKRPELILKEGALLMNLTAQSLADEFLGRVCVFSGQNEVTLLNQRICSFESKLEYDVKPYLYLVFKSPQFRAFVDTLDSGTLIKHLNVKDVKSYTFLLPEENEQTEIVRRVEELFAFADRIEQSSQAALSRVNNLTQSILAKAFRGELTLEWRAANPELISGENSAEALLAKIKTERAKLNQTKKGRGKSVEN